MLKERKITQSEINSLNVKSVPGSRLKGTVQENKHVFDKLVEFVAERLNGVIGDLTDDAEGTNGADSISSAPIEGLQDPDNPESPAKTVWRQIKALTAEQRAAVAEIEKALKKVPIAYRLEGTDFVFTLDDGTEISVSLETFLVRAPKIGENGNWYVWDPAVGGHVDSGKPARGPVGPMGPQGIISDLQSGTYGMYINSDGHLIVAVNTGDPLPPLSLDDGGHLIYTII